MNNIDWTSDSSTDLIEFAQEYARCEAMCLHVGDLNNAAEYTAYVEQIQAELGRRNINLVRGA